MMKNILEKIQKHRLVFSILSLVVLYLSSLYIIIRRPAETFGSRFLLRLLGFIFCDKPINAEYCFFKVALPLMLLSTFFAYICISFLIYRILAKINLNRKNILIGLFFGVFLGFLFSFMNLKEMESTGAGFLPDIFPTLAIIFIFYFIFGLLLIIIKDFFIKKEWRTFVLSLCVLILLLTFSNAYKVETQTEVHQYISQQSKYVWNLVPFEIELFLNNSILTGTNIWLDSDEYNLGDDVIDGSAEEDIVPNSRNHFWNPDNTTEGTYNDGLDYYFEYDSSYRKALDYWDKQILPLYLKGDINESYYWLGKVAHLLQDATVPAHMHNNEHLGDCAEDNDDESLECYTGGAFTNWQGSTYQGQQYNYDNLPNMSSFNWAEVEPTRAVDKQHRELFRLFWYTAQKTQYFASDDVDGNNQYVNLSNAQKPFPIPLWFEDGITVLNESEYLAQDDETNSGDNITKVANATIPHAMKSVAGLYKLFWDAVHIDWPTDHHDYRRTGFTLLKGDMEKESDVEQLDIVLKDNVEEDTVIRPSVADLDGNERMDIVSVVHDLQSAYKTDVFIVDKKRWWKKVQQKTFYNGSVLLPPTLGNIDGDKQKEVIVGLRYGEIYALDVSSGGTVSEKWSSPYILPAKYSDVSGFDVVECGGGSAVVDIDLDGTNEIILTSKARTTPDYTWPGEVYILDGSGSTATKEGNYTFGNGGAFASVSIANIDDDDNPEIIVPSFYGIVVLDYNASAPDKLSKKWNNSDGLILGSAVIYDVDMDNEYEIVYVTTDGDGSASKTRDNKLYIRDAETGNSEKTIDLGNYDARVTPAIANLDSDSQAEIVISLRNSSDVNNELGQIIAYDSSTGNVEWAFNDSGTLQTSFVAPDIADIDNDGNYNIIFAENGGTKVFVLKEDGSPLFNYSFTGVVDSALAIADLDADGVAEIALKRAGSPIGILSTASGYNKPPVLNTISNITAIVGDLIDINESGEVTATDPDNDNLTFYYSSPFNSSGLWQTTINDTGNYSILIEVSDSSLSDYQYVDVIVFNSTSFLQNNFTDSTNQKLLNFSSAGNQTVKVRIAKNATILYSKIKLEGKAP